MLKSKFILLLSSVFVCTAGVAQVNGQEFNANVTVNMELVPIDQRDDIMTMESDVTTYINNQRFTEEPWESEPIEVNVNIFLMSRQGNNYSARLVISSQRPLLSPEGARTMAMQFYDENWFFPYSRNAVHGFAQGHFDLFSSQLDFYLFLALGLDFDSFGELDGTYFYEQAFQIWQLGSARNAPGYELEFEPGEITKYTVINEIVNPRYEKFRELIFEYYVDGLDELGQNPELAYKNLEATLGSMVRFKDQLVGSSSFMQAWFDSKHEELAEIFKGYAKRDLILKMLSYLDPGHSSLYLEALGD